MPTTKHQTTIAKIFTRLAKKHGVKIIVEPEYGYAMQITTKQGRKVYVRSVTFPLNNLGAAAIARDKGNTSYFLKNMGYPVPNGRVFYSKKWGRQIGSKDTINASVSYAEKLGWPIIVKPNDASGGELVFLCNNRKEFFYATSLISPNHDIFNVQKYIEGMDYRLLVLDGEVVAAYQRLPLCVLGDGKKTVAQLLRAKKIKFNNNSDCLMARIVATLKQQKLKVGSVLKKDRMVELLPSANLSSGGRAIDVLDKTHADWKKLAVKIATDMNLRYCGIDIISQKPLSEKPMEYVVLEVNAAPGIGGFALGGKEQKKKAEEIYEKIFLKII